MNKIYKIHETKYINPPGEYLNASLYPNFQDALETFKDRILHNIKSGTSASYYKFGDGDYYFLNQIPKGSAKPGRRALKKSYEELDIQPFLEGYLKNDQYATLITSANMIKFQEMFSQPLDVPSEVIYGLISNKWLFENSKCKIGIIGAKPKLKIIQKLMKFEQYQDYLKIDSFNDYIYIDQNFTCDNLNKTKDKLYKQLRKSDSDLFLLGVGHVKSGLLHELKNIKPAVYLDIGIGVDAIAGLVNIYRPYFGEWNNFKINNSRYLYRNIDILINNFGSLGNTVELK